MEEIADIQIEDGVSFRITKISDIMEEHEYPGIRIMMEAILDRMRQAVKIDISTGDVITPGAVEFSYKLMFEERSFSDEKTSPVRMAGIPFLRSLNPRHYDGVRNPDVLAGSFKESGYMV